ncbi:uncharacterized protein METZ01_LOCUS213904 [marine metagenome]|uniref:RDD domain-containing protein n=1 Tax=marine metagenome TaxID=408172 RepID=A0A382FDQ1_9ZZZZ
MSENDDNSGGDQSTYETPTAPSEEAGTPSGPDLAGRGRRLGAYLIDLIIAGIVLVILAVLNIGISFEDVARDPMTQQMSTAGGIAYLVIFMVINGYLLVTKGQTLGKLALDIRIVDAASNGAATAVKILGLRYVLVMLVGAIPIIGGLLGIIDFLFIFREDRRCVHDLIAGTKVVSNP